MRIAAPTALAAFCLLAVTTGAGACGGSIACSVEGGTYRIELPRSGDATGKSKARGAYVFFHGHRSSAKLQMRHRALVGAAHRHGLAFVAVDGLKGSWSHPNAPGRFRDEAAFIRNVLDDLEKRFGFDRSNTLAGGFSQGASMAWYGLCWSGDRFAGAVTFSGVFWEPIPKPEDCVTDLPPMIHFHGRQDETFPLAGRAVGSRFHQGDTFKSITVAREAARCERDVENIVIADFSCSLVAGCVRGGVTLCLYDGGHQVQPDYLDIGLTRLGF
ncbi:poly(3-hydroxybutyrate) depolymerase [Sinorhizobium medicae]|uniref:Poly(3-hydroxybutyrate) depolymerase n=2 Tax=Sinorhizobium medicae TaxID=110321 RepID=A0ABX4TKV5_9HYPH|nr:poly(3-hydroxybutyrate) depolymerase [Sinorhizobium medicae]MDX0451990.1 poly(3-hydroxybutyrate) depolymerase [Sinorhizobium medicae]MDX0513648.1 poly(3-hydroxybutyrate) depolymerase [Sinorhizobium medicae]MDX0724042.1 poly(3-hydroxybutyrate) depolymerase [Sinorhizobium medicae]MDX0730278.1 poly(3-hydroxybutyrate) depolymerase [Sinorhizobium medicae]MDX0767649.1 poly(3-hydroxybutyrate) depolymerase [Sinorhizobium medicae]